jgi:quercetin dioxygenase-like cupin family protein
VNAHVIENPVSGERIVIHRSAADTGGRLLAWELFLAPGGRVPSSHAHPGQQERFTVLAGRMRFRVGARSRTVGPGETVIVPPRTVHSFANAGRETAHVLVETTPALGMEALLATAAAMACEQRAAGRSLPRLGDLVLFMRDFESEVVVPYVPPAMVRPVIRAFAGVATALGVDRRYRRLRA